MNKIIYDDVPLLGRLIAGPCMVIAGILITGIHGAPQWPGISVATIGVLVLLSRQRLELDIGNRRWKWEMGIWPLMSRKTGGFSDLKAIQLDRKMLAREGSGFEPAYRAELVWQSGSPSPKKLLDGPNIRVVADKAGNISRLTGLPLIESKALHEFRAQLSDLPMLE